MLRLFAWIWALGMAGMIGAGEAKAGTEVLLADGRRFEIVLPRGVVNPPLIVALHGGAGSGSSMESLSQLTEKAVGQGFAVAYPDGSGRGRALTWNAGFCCAYAARRNVDDVGFIEAVISVSAERFGIDRRNVFLVGMSNGAMMSQTIAARRPDLVRAVGTVSGPLDIGRERIRGQVPLMHFHGTADDVVPYEGGIGERTVNRKGFPPIEAVIGKWVETFGERLTVERRVIDPARDGTRVVRTAYSGKGHERVVLYTIEGGSHSWPGARRAGRGGVSQDVDASAEMIGFFERNVRK